MGIHSYLVPARFLSMLGHFLATLLVFFSYRDNIVVALRFEYDSDEYDRAKASVVAAMVLTCICLAVQAAGFFSGFTMFDVSLAMMHCICHVTASVLLSVVVIEKWHHATLWPIFGFFSALPTVFELFGILSAAFLNKRRW